MNKEGPIPVVVYFETRLQSCRPASEVRAILLDPSCSGSGTVAVRLDHLLPSHGVGNADATDVDRLAEKTASFPEKGFGTCVIISSVMAWHYVATNGGCQERFLMQEDELTMMSGRLVEKQGNTSCASSQFIMEQDQQSLPFYMWDNTGDHGGSGVGVAEDRCGGESERLCNGSVVGWQCTCSIHQIENEDVIKSILPLASSFGFQLATPFPHWPRRGLPVVQGWEKSSSSSSSILFHM
ncbi:S-adenosyl-L-methionine-dependent methyltransferases superfamily protein [Actinidia rufa]|uniref:S-adenosyl-L-methionine-dependent methyltransferases superfamily protein n=1 Tax=Actinidia rufa TaxID=165716 RepID=A0A7J0GXK2_9ERIC|nr:S-adenosyl-L-methionine-dependent methyltransferases superfamily protein [Actinidia rufa]